MNGQWCFWSSHWLRPCLQKTKIWVQYHISVLFGSYFLRHSYVLFTEMIITVFFTNPNHQRNFGYLFDVHLSWVISLNINPCIQEDVDSGVFLVLGPLQCLVTQEQRKTVCTLAARMWLCPLWATPSCGGRWVLQTVHLGQHPARVEG